MQCIRTLKDCKFTSLKRESITCTADFGTAPAHLELTEPPRSQRNRNREVRIGGEGSFFSLQTSGWGVKTLLQYPRRGFDSQGMDYVSWSRTARVRRSMKMKHRHSVVPVHRSCLFSGRWTFLAPDIARCCSQAHV